MKTLLITFSLALLALGASAQRKEERHEGEGHEVYRQRLVVVPSVGFGFGYGNPYFGNPYFGNPYFDYPYGYMSPYPYYHSRRMPYKLSLQIQSIKIDYKNKIRNARRDKSISHSQRRAEIRNLKAERDQAIIDAQSNFSGSGRNNNDNGNNNGNNNLQ